MEEHPEVHLALAEHPEVLASKEHQEVHLASKEHLVDRRLLLLVLVVLQAVLFKSKIT